MATGWSIFSGMSWLWAFENWVCCWKPCVGFFYGRVDAWRDRQIGKEVAQQREVVVEEEKRRVELHEPIVIETPPPEVPVSKKAEQRVEREKQAMLFPEAIIGGQLPPLHLLDPAPPATETVSAETLEYTSRLIERKLADFGVQVKVLAAMPGPVITRYEIEPAVGVKGAQIVNLARDLARALAMVSIRVVETVPGKSCMALELPNPKRQMVKLSEIISSKPYNDMSSPLTVCLGKDIGGLPVVADLAKTPHLLVAGYHRLRQVGRRQCHDPVDALQVRAGSRAPDHGRPEDARTVDLRRHSAPAGAGGHRHEAGGQRAALVRDRDGEALQADVGHGRAQHRRPQHQDPRGREEAASTSRIR
jgi:S-DNA-T family DNA segregation ATPase FtsK/SpoIIIE